MAEDLEAEGKKPSKAWYLLPIFLSIIGGVIGYFLVKDRDKKLAERLLIAGVIMMVVWIIFSFLLAGAAYIYLAGLMSR